MSTAVSTKARDSSGAAGRRPAPVVAWAALGAVSALLIVVVLGRWLAGGVGSVDPGPDPFGGTKLVLLRVLEWGQFGVFLVLGWRFVLRPITHHQPLGFDGLFILAALLLNFWDPLDNYWSFSFQYNAHHLNVESWGTYIPGWHSPGGEVWAVPVGFVFGAYCWAFFLAVRMGCAILERVGSAHPTWPRWRAWAAVFVASAGISAIAENVYLRLDAIANIQTAPALTAWHGEAGGWPVYNPIFFGLTWTVLTALRWSRHDDGLSFVERGVTTLRIPGGAQTAVRFLAIFAFMEVTYIGLYFVPWNLLSTLGDPISDPASYFPVP